MRYFLLILVISVKIVTSRSKPVENPELANRNYWIQYLSNSNELNDVLDDRARFEGLFEDRQKFQPTYTYGDSFNIDDRAYPVDDLTEYDLNAIATHLIKLLEQPSWKSPLMLLDVMPLTAEIEEIESRPFDSQMPRNLIKRSRYYRKYPRKREHYRFQDPYETDTSHFCMPSRDDIFQLLGALHELRRGDKNRHVHFCNRPRTARTLLAHMRFLGRRK